MGYTHGIQWSDELIEEMLENAIASLELDRFPTHKELESFYGNKALTCKMANTGGTEYWAEKLGYKYKRCESEIGKKYEIYSIADIFKHTGYKSYKNKVGYPYDITTEKHIKVDIKSSKIFINNHGYATYTFNLEKKEPTCDIYILYCIDNNDQICKTYVIPSCALYGQTQIGISAFSKSKRDKYKDNWGLFDMYYEFYNNILRNNS